MISSFNECTRPVGTIDTINSRMEGTSSMSQITDIIKIAQKENPKLASMLQDYYTKEASRRKFGLVYESHLPELFEVGTHEIRKGDVVVERSPRGKFEPNGSERFLVKKVYNQDDVKVADIASMNDESIEDDRLAVSVDSLIKVVSQSDVIYPGLVPDGEVIGDAENDTFHSVICAENYDALRMMGSTDLIGKVDCIYIDPPYNTGNKDWIYNNDYVDGSDEFRSSAFMNFLERRLQEAKLLLNPDDSVLILTIDEKEYLNVGMLLRQVFSGARIQMISSVINPKGVANQGKFLRDSEYLFIIMNGDAHVNGINLSSEWSAARSSKTGSSITWSSLRRSGGLNDFRHSRPNLFYPIYVNEKCEIVKIGDPLDRDFDVSEVEEIKGCSTLFPINFRGEEVTWQQSSESAKELLKKGYIRVKKIGDEYSISYIKRGEQEKIEKGIFSIVGRDDINGTIIVEGIDDNKESIPISTWNIQSHNATSSGTSISNALYGEKRFDYPKSLYAVEDVLRFFVTNKPNATVIDFFGGSGTTAHAVMRLNEQDGGERRSITVTINDIGIKRMKNFSKQGLQSGDPEWEQFGVYEYATKPRITAAITGKTAKSNYTEPIKGYYKYNDFQDEYPIGDPIPKDKAKQFADGMKQNVRFFHLKYLSYRDIYLDMEDNHLYPLLWLEQGQQGELPQDVKNVLVADTYAIVKKISKFDDAVKDLPETVRTIYVHADEATASQLQKSISQDIEVVPLWDLYIQRMKTKTIN